MRRRALLAASAASGGGGGEFYCKCLMTHPMTGAIISEKTYTFVLDRPKTWGECGGLSDISGTVRIDVFTIFGDFILAIEYIDDMSMVTSFSPEEDILITDNVKIGYTYIFRS